MDQRNRNICSLPKELEHLYTAASKRYYGKLWYGDKFSGDPYALSTWRDDINMWQTVGYEDTYVIIW